jgi:hypothetical protein
MRFFYEYKKKDSQNFKFYLKGFIHMPNSSRTEIITYLSEQEEVIATLYTSFSLALPKMKEFWNKLVVQEKAHAQILKQLAELCESEDIYVNPNKFNVAAIKTNIESMRKKITQVSSEGITPIGAFSLAVDIEHSLIEADYFRIIESNAPHIKKELEAIQHHTIQHIKLVEAGLKRSKDIN